MQENALKCNCCFTYVSPHFQSLVLQIMIPSVTLTVLKEKANKKGDVKVYIRFTSNRKSAYICTQITIPIASWDFKRQKIKSSFKQANLCNMLLERKVSEIREKLMIHALTSGHITANQAKKLALRKSNFSFFSLSDEYVDRLEKENKIGSADKVRAIFNKFENFLGGRSVTFYDIDEKVLLDYQAYLRDELENGVSTIHTNMKTIRRIFSMAVERNIISEDDNPFKRIKLRTEKAIRPFLTEQEIRELVLLKFKGQDDLEKSRDVFVWTLLAGGMRISDVMLLRKSNFDGETLVTRIKKTGKEHRIKLPEVALMIYQKYASKIDADDGYLFGLIPESAYKGTASMIDKAISTATSIYNKDLKKLAVKAGIKKNITSHIARISFITLAVSSGVDMTTVQGIAGHSDVEMTAHYSKYVDNQGDRALKTIEDKIIQNELG